MGTVIEGMNHFARDDVDRRIIRDLVDAWAQYADRRQPTEQAALFTAAGTVRVYTGDAASTEPVQRLQATPSWRRPSRSSTTTGSRPTSTGRAPSRSTANQARGETHRLAHHIWTEDGQRMVLVISIRYLDRFVRQDGAWRFADRQLITDWTEQRPSSPAS